jgi:2-hydroxy-6-oxonona-2,4-dienedioate hydrolase
MSELTYEGTSKFVQAGDFRVHYNEAGSGDPLIFLHGSGPGATSWSNFVQNFGYFAEHYHVYLVDQPGYGESDTVLVGKDTTRSKVNSDAVADFMAALKIPKASLVGNSMGGATVLSFAVDNPEKLDKLVLMGSGGAGGLVFAPMPTEGLKLRDASFRQPSLESIRAFIEVMVHDSSFVTDALLQQRYDAMMINEDHIENFNKSNPVQRDIVSKLREIVVPTLLIHGREDRVVPFEASLRLQAAIPNSELHVFNKCGHWTQYERADRFNQLVLSFLQDG